MQHRKERVTRKRRHKNQVQGDLGESIVADKFPPHWVVRKLAPDFGLDLHVEVFDGPVDAVPAETRGEHFYVQVKSVAGTNTVKKQVWHRGNVAKSGIEVRGADSVEIDVVPCVLETSELLTVEAMGASVPVLLSVVDVESERVWYLCLNDYLAKVLLPQNPAYADQDTVTVHLPSWNVLDSEDIAFTYFWQVARRGKLYAAFNQFAYQNIELAEASQRHPMTVDASAGLAKVSPELLSLARVFVESNLRLDVWETAGPGYWSPLFDIADELEALPKAMEPFADWQPLDSVERFLAELEWTFRRSMNLGRMYEELVREWRMPTALATLMDYADGSAYNPPDFKLEEADVRRTIDD